MNKEELLEYIKSLVEETSLRNGWDEAYRNHISIVPKMAEELLDIPRFANADKFTVLMGAWLHDFAKMNCNLGENRKEGVLEIHKVHHIEGYKLAKEVLSGKLPEEEVEKIAQCVLRHRNREDYPATTDEEMLVAAADSMSHFKSIVYLLYYYYYPNSQISEMVTHQLGKVERDWRDVSLIPEAAEMCRKEYEVIKSMLESNK